MNGLSFSELCCLFCCPPFPSRIAAKVAFLPPEPTYSFVADESGTKFTLNLTDRAEWQFLKENWKVRSYDYSGYGISTGKPSEKNLYADVDAAWHALRTRYGISPENIILYGQSIGTVPTVDLASRYEVGAVILHSPLMSGMRVAFPNTKRTWFLMPFLAFRSSEVFFIVCEMGNLEENIDIDKVPKVTSPVLVIHGTEDEVIDFSHGLAIYESCPRAVEPLWVEGAGHNDVELYGQYLERLKQFVSMELVN
ncbi:hypothetical protein TNCT_351741 [Trichonephila clavata]|uniref:Serine aminopeptidase S33 domain-containing protein n=1 Tax=Trichonephila clavata TaxID=2740835 RepID=A0A8X6I163_TRICU|nr:hypothetical protein TNCT_351741 [Trichonephila clavata]